MKHLKTTDAISSMELNLKEYTESVSELVIDDGVSAYSAKNLLSLINKDIKDVEDMRKSIVKPYNDIVKQINSLSKERQAEYEPIKKALQSKMLEYQEEIDKKKAEEEKIINDAQKESDNSAEVKEIVEVETRQINYEYNQSRARGVYLDYEIESVDIDKIPNEYLEVKEGKIRTDLRKGKKIHGVKYKEVKKVK